VCTIAPWYVAVTCVLSCFVTVHHSIDQEREVHALTSYRCCFFFLLLTLSLQCDEDFSGPFFKVRVALVFYVLLLSF